MDKSANYPVTDNIRRLIKGSGRSQNQIAVEARMTPQRLSDLMTGRGTIKASEIYRISNALDVEPTVLFKTRE